MTSRVILCIFIPLVPSTDQIYHLPASRLGDKFNISMTLIELITQYNTTCHFLISKTYMTASQQSFKWIDIKDFLLKHYSLAMFEQALTPSL